MTRTPSPAWRKWGRIHVASTADNVAHVWRHDAGPAFGYQWAVKRLFASVPAAEGVADTLPAAKRLASAALTRTIAEG